MAKKWSVYRWSAMIGIPAAIVTIIVGIIVVATFFSNSSTGARADDASGNCNITGGTNSGTINNNCPTINQAPKPDLKTLNQKTVTNPDGSSTFSALVEVVAPYPPADMSITARAEGIISLDGESQGVGSSIMMVQRRVEKSYAFENVQNPHGQYMIVVHLAKANPVTLEHHFD